MPLGSFILISMAELKNAMWTAAYLVFVLFKLQRTTR